MLVPTEGAAIAAAERALDKGFGKKPTLMREGATWEFTVPPALAYGAKGLPGSVPPNAVLVFDIPLPRPGLYAFEISLDGELGSRVPLTAAQVEN